MNVIHANLLVSMEIFGIGSKQSLQQLQAITALGLINALVLALGALCRG